ncbi:hypothetical protein [Lentibacillus sp.]|uniref:hypothetical protein n=1 Tax=Lentibacillus sp. TaxID=1925746 RepID=UPI002B4B5F09|nr:hypothetical protein [Lentibacillus sp.]HLS08064.1 hypothetical protein [Lentibacillus sp.]
MALNVRQKLIKDHLVFGKMKPGAEIGLQIDQALTHDATGTLRDHEHEITVEHNLSERQREVILSGGLINWIKSRQQKV